MNHSLATKLLTLIKVNYVQWAKELTRADAEALIELWATGLDGVDYRQAEYAVKKHCQTSKWPPSISEILEMINLMNGMEKESVSAVLAEITKAVFKSYKDESEEYSNLSNTARQVVRDPYMIKEWRKCENFNEVIAPGLRKSLKEQIDLNYTKTRLGIPLEQIDYEHRVKIPKKLEPRLGENRITEISKDEIEEAIRRLKGGD